MENTVYNRLLELCKPSMGDVITFLHNTKSKAIAQNISEYGFEFSSHLDYTTDVVSVKDPLTIKYFTNVREAYGHYTLVMQISREIILKISEALDGNPHHYSEVLSISKPWYNEDHELVYKLAPHFIKGYLNQLDNTFVDNPTFDAHKQIEQFDKNLHQLLSSGW